ncbi:MAG: YceI family protein [Myxococcota bacterium]
MKRFTVFLAAPVLTFTAIALIACENPADKAVKGKVEEAQPVGSNAEGSQAMVPPADGASGEKLTIDPSTSQITWVGSKVTGKHDGGFKTFTGSINLDPKNLAASVIKIDIDTNSLYADNEKLTTHLKSADFFNVEKHPKASFESTKIVVDSAEGATHQVTGNLTLNGVTKSVTFPATINVSNSEVSSASEFAINRKDWNLVYPGMPDDLIRDEVVVKLSVKASRAQGA